MNIFWTIMCEILIMTICTEQLSCEWRIFWNWNCYLPDAVHEAIRGFHSTSLEMKIHYISVL